MFAVSRKTIKIFAASILLITISSMALANDGDVENFLAGARFSCAYDITKKHPEYPNVPKATIKNINDDCHCLIDITFEKYGKDKIVDIFIDHKLFNEVVPICQDKGFLQHIKK